jgi:hypothetical protein
LLSNRVAVSAEAAWGDKDLPAADSLLVKVIDPKKGRPTLWTSHATSMMSPARHIYLESGMISHR